MLTETARIVALDEHSLWVQTVRKDGCGKCADGGACSCAMLGGGAILGGGGKSRVRHLQLPRSELPETLKDAPLQIGQELELGLEEGALLGGVFLMYLAPLLGLLAGAMIANALQPGELSSTLGGALGFVAGLVPTWRWNRRGRRSGRLQPRVLRALATVRRAEIPAPGRETVP